MNRVASVIGLLAVPLLMAVALAAAPAVMAGDPCYHGFVIPARTTGTDTQIKLAPCAFAPTVTHVAAGSTVTFFNGPDFTHLVTGANQAWGSRDVEIQPGQTVSYRFDEPGVYPYACALHRGMSGTIVVGDLTAAMGAGSVVATPPVNEGANAAAAGDDRAWLAAGTIGGVAMGAIAVWLASRRNRHAVSENLVRAD